MIEAPLYRSHPSHSSYSSYLSTIALLHLASFTLACWGVLTPLPATSAPLPQDTYVWQRSWNEPTLAALVQYATNFSEVAALNAEIVWTSGQSRIIRVPLNYEALRLSGRPVGVVLRIGPFPGPFATNDPPATVVTETARSLIAAATANQLQLAELQVDFDCAESKLDGYCRWVEALRRAVAPVPLVITALPAWLRQPAFQSLANLADGVVLQVHSLERPRNFDTPFTLCDPDSAKRAVAQMAALGRPFRVALPTYGYLLAFSTNGNFVGLSAEGPASTWPAGVRTREVRADPDAMADLVRDWTATRPKEMSGIIWYRLPVSGEHLNWTWPTLAAVMGGRHPQPQLRASARQPESNLVEIDLQNSGEGEYSGPVTVRMGWKLGRVLGSDGLNGFRITETQTNAIMFQRLAGRIEPAQHRTIGWARLEKDSDVQIEVIEPK